MMGLSDGSTEGSLHFKLNVVTYHQNPLIETVLMRAHYIIMFSFRNKTISLYPQYPLLSEA